ncbi:hypothetical protein TSARBOMBA_34 [Bacillus phage TsarBomba]|uniref:Uncharacterized protein n=1 Tax=Bacillus phage TsarBomba TaxID=1690456 RepID=A0A0K2D074_9CAUD|nr:hypothetical protein TSARBOMBA_34 [Bacillus phage TsarBomba]ALA13150.1 hypothetical protein TSARBOMBA_34 [Bacillus phage TsarBomba]
MEETFNKVVSLLGMSADSARNLERGLLTGNLDVDSPEVYNEIVKIEKKLEKALVVLQDLEDRKQEEALKNVNLDKLFEGHPVNAYVQAMLGFLPSDNFKEINVVDLISNLSKAGLELAKHQQKAEQSLQKAEAPKPKTEDEFVHYVTDSLDLAHPDLADTYKDALRLGIDQLKRHGHGVAPFVIPLKSGAAYGKLRVHKRVIEIKLNDLTFVFDPKEVEEYSAEEAAVEPVPCPAEDQVVPCTCDDKADCSKPCERDVIVDLAIAHLTDKKEFTGSDYDLIRYFLRVVEGAADEEVNSLSNRALELAWKRHWYLRNEK